MSCRKIRRRLSAHMDGALSALEGLDVETHLRGCGACRRYHRQLERAVGMVRRLEPLGAPRFSLHRVRRGATSRADRAALWERIRSRRLAPPRALLRPVAFAALALMLVLAVMQSLDRPTEQPAAGAGPVPVEPGFDTAQIPIDRPPSTPEERSDALKREIARQVLQAQARGTSPGSHTAIPPGEQLGDEPQRIAELDEQPPPAEATGEDPPPIHPAAEPLAAATQVAALTTPETGPAGGESAFVAPEEDPAGAGLTAPAEEPGTAASATPVVPVPLVMIGALETAARGKPEPTQAPAPAPARAQRNRLVRSAPTEPDASGGEPAPVEIAAAYHIVAVFAEETENEELTFQDPETRSAELESIHRLDGQVAVERSPESEPTPPEPDTDTGVTPPVVLEQPGPALGARAAQVRERGLLSPLGLRLTLSPEGNVDEVARLSTTGLVWLDDVVVDAVRSWSFRPAEDLGGEPVAAVLELVIDFDLD